jgi:hypothetical protein
METPNTRSLVPRLRELGLTQRGVEQVFSTFHATTEPFRQATRGG